MVIRKGGSKTLDARMPILQSGQELLKGSIEPRQGPGYPKDEVDDYVRALIQNNRKGPAGKSKGKVVAEVSSTSSALASLHGSEVFPVGPHDGEPVKEWRYSQPPPQCVIPCPAARGVSGGSAAATATILDTCGLKTTIPSGGGTCNHGVTGHPSTGDVTVPQTVAGTCQELPDLHLPLKAQRTSSGCCTPHSECRSLFLFKEETPPSHTAGVFRIDQDTYGHDIHARRKVHARRKKERIHNLLGQRQSLSDPSSYGFLELQVPACRRGLGHDCAGRGALPEKGDVSRHPDMPGSQALARSAGMDIQAMEHEDSKLMEATRGGGDLPQAEGGLGLSGAARDTACPALGDGDPIVRQDDAAGEFSHQVVPELEAGAGTQTEEIPLMQPLPFIPLNSGTAPGGYVSGVPVLQTRDPTSLLVAAQQLQLQLQLESNLMTAWQKSFPLPSPMPDIPLGMPQIRTSGAHPNFTPGQSNIPQCPIQPPCSICPPPGAFPNASLTLPGHGPGSVPPSAAAPAVHGGQPGGSTWPLPVPVSYPQAGFHPNGLSHQYVIGAPPSSEFAPLPSAFPQVVPNMGGPPAQMMQLLSSWYWMMQFLAVQQYNGLVGAQAPGMYQTRPPTPLGTGLETPSPAPVPPTLYPTAGCPQWWGPQPGVPVAADSFSDGMGDGGALTWEMMVREAQALASEAASEQSARDPHTMNRRGTPIDIGPGGGTGSQYYRGHRRQRRELIKEDYGNQALSESGAGSESPGPSMVDVEALRGSEVDMQDVDEATSKRQFPRMM